MANKKMNRILTLESSEEIRVHGVGGVLSLLFQTILIDLRIKPSQWSGLLNEYIADPKNRVPRDRTKQMSERGNMMKAFSKEDMTWKNICKGFRVLQFRRIEITIRAFHRHGGRISTHTIGADFEHPESEDSFGSDEDVNNTKDPKEGE